MVRNQKSQHYLFLVWISECSIIRVSNLKNTILFYFCKTENTHTHTKRCLVFFKRKKNELVLVDVASAVSSRYVDYSVLDDGCVGQSVWWFVVQIGELFQWKLIQKKITVNSVKAAMNNKFGITRSMWVNCKCEAKKEEKLESLPISHTHTYVNNHSRCEAQTAVSF